MTYDPLAGESISEPGAWDRPDDRFIPIRACDLTRLLENSAPRWKLAPESLGAFVQALQGVVDRETGTFERQLADSYAAFNPDRDMISLTQPSPPPPETYEELFGQLAHLLNQANFERLDEVQIEQAVLRARARSLHVRVDPKRVERLEIWVRGQSSVVRVTRPWWSPWRPIYERVPIFRRLAVVARLRNDPYVLLKVFKEIPEADVEALLPHAEIAMSWFDRLKLLGTSAGTLGITVTKVLKLFAAVAAIWYLAWIVLIGLATLGVRTALGYRNARTHRDWQRTRHLYFQNLGNNASALQLLVATVKQEEFKEVLLAYVFCHAHTSGEGSGRDANIKREIEQFLFDKCGSQVDFDWSDAWEKLSRYRLWQSAAECQVVSVEEAIARLDELRCDHHPIPVASK